jgi:hypothetical protein
MDAWTVDAPLCLHLPLRPQAVNDARGTANLARLHLVQDPRCRQGASRCALITASGYKCIGMGAVRDGRCVHVACV